MTAAGCEMMGDVHTSAVRQAVGGIHTCSADTQLYKHHSVGVKDNGVATDSYLSCL